MPIPWLATYLLQSFHHTRRASPSVPTSSWPYLHFLWNSTHVSSFLLLNRNKRNIVLVSQPLILSNVCIVHDQFSLPTAKTAWTWSTSLQHFTFHGTFLQSLPCLLSAFFPQWHRAFSLPIHGAAQYLGPFLKGKLVAPRCCAQIHVNLHF